MSKSQFNLEAFAKGQLTEMATMVAGFGIGTAGLKMIRSRVAGMNGFGALGAAIKNAAQSNIGQFAPNVIAILASGVGYSYAKNPHIKKMFIGVGIAGIADAVTRLTGKNYFAGFGNTDITELAGGPAYDYSLESSYDYSEDFGIEGLGSQYEVELA